MTYAVTAEADEDGEVTASVHSAVYPDAKVASQIRLRAIYTAGVLTQLLDGVFERPTIAELSEGADPTPVSVANLSSNALLKAFAQQYTAALSESGMIEALAAREAINPIAIDAEMRAVRPVHGLAVDGALCGVETVDAANSRFLQRLSIRHSLELDEMLGLDTRPSSAGKPEPHRLRIIARLGDDGHLEHGVELSSGEQILPPERLLRTHAVIGRWQMSGDVEVDGSPIGRIRGRRVAGGRFEMGFVSVDGEAITPDIAFLPADRPVGIWFRSSEIEVAAVMLMDSVDPASG